MRLNSITNSILNISQGLVFGNCRIPQNQAHSVNGESEKRRIVKSENTGCDFNKKNGNLKYSISPFNFSDVALKSRINGCSRNIPGQIHREKLENDEILYVISDKKDDKPFGYAILSLNFKDLQAFLRESSDELREYCANAPYLKKIISYKDEREDKILGIGTNLVKCALKESIRAGYDGRMTVLACDTKNPDNAPTIFYHKLGFRFLDEEYEKIFSNLEKNGKTDAKNVADKGVNIGVMYLPKENIPQLLNA